jgi:hypothetical protein
LEFRVGCLITCPQCGAEFDAAKNLSAHQRSLLDRGPVRLQCAACGTVFDRDPDPTAAAQLAAARLAQALALLVGAIVAAAAVALVAFPPHKANAAKGGGVPAPPAADGGPVQPPALPPPPEGPAFWVADVASLTKTLPAEFNTSFAFRAKHPFLVALERSPRFAADVLLDATVQDLAGLRAAIEEDFGAAFDLRPFEHALPVVVLASREAYERYRERRRGDPLPGAVGAHYEDDRRRLVLSSGARGDLPALFHEGTHQIVHAAARTARGPGSFWFQEGLACYYEAFERDAAGAVRFHVVNRHRLPDAAEADAATPLETLLRLSVDDVWKGLEDPALDAAARTRRARALYAEAWALWHLLLHTTPERRQAAVAVVEAELKGEGGAGTFARVLGDPAALEAALRGHVRALRAETARPETGTQPRPR